MNRLWHDPNGDKIFANTGPNSWEHTSGSGSGSVAHLEKRINELETKLKAYEVNLYLLSHSCIGYCSCGVRTERDIIAYTVAGIINYI